MYTPTQKKKIRATIPPYCAKARANEWRIHYTQARPFWYYNDLGSSYANLDCSGFVGNVFWNAMHDTGIYIRDPLNERWRGIGYTGTLEYYLRAHGKRVVEANGFLIGDIARAGYGEHAHTYLCHKAGSATASRWTSHGWEGGPLEVTLNYRNPNDLVGVWRIPELL